MTKQKVLILLVAIAFIVLQVEYVDAAVTCCDSCDTHGIYGWVKVNGVKTGGITVTVRLNGSVVKECTTDSGGNYYVCGLTADSEYNVSARSGGNSDDTNKTVSATKCVSANLTL